MSQANLDAIAAAETASTELAMRVRLGASPTTPAATLNFLADDPAVTVRAAVALNPGASFETDERLASDPDERVRLLLARKAVALLPGLSPADQQRVGEQTLSVLSTLVRDEAVRVRVLVAEVLASLPGVPRDLVLTLAQDCEIPVSEPVLRLSPLLSASDLLALLQDPPHAVAKIAIATRANLPPMVSEAIAQSGDDAAIRALLANPSAAIQESVLDALIARARDKPDWQGPLVRRPVLPAHAARALSEIVAGHWLQVLMERDDLPPGLLSELKQRVWSRLAGDHRGSESIADDAMMQAALRLDAHGLLDEAALMDAARAGDCRRATALLAVAAGVSLDIVDRAANLRSAKALVSLVWKAGFSMRVAGPVQSLIGRLGPAGVLSMQNGTFPLAAEEMAWHLELLAHDPR